MGKKGDKLTSNSVIAAESIVERLAGLDGITSKKMFGGHGIFHDAKMFGIVDSEGRCYLKADDANREEFLAMGATKQSRMPYFTIPDEVLEDDDKLLSWAGQSIAISG